MVKFSTQLIFVISLIFAPAVFGIEQEELLPPDQAFRFSASVHDPETVELSWDIAEGYYLYRKKFKFSSKSPGIRLDEAQFPPGKIKNDQYFGEMEVYRGKINILLPVQRNPGENQLDLQAVSQGCADLGVCYPPHKQTTTVTFPPQDKAITTPDFPKSLNNFDRALQSLGLGSAHDELLPPDQAFQFSAEVKDSQTIRAQWQIADDYYLYREKFQFTLSDNENTHLGTYQIPRGKPKHEENFGDVEVFYNQIAVDLPLIRTASGPTRIELTAKYQGCAERGVCYPPMQKTVGLQLPENINPPTTGESKILSEQGTIAQALKNKTVWFTGLSFFGFGLLLAFTPCIFPMIPILSGLIIGQGERITVGHGFLISLSYVVASALMYTAFGVLAGLFGSNLQIIFQTPWVIVSFSLVFVALALSMFGFYNLEIPSSLQSRLTVLSNNQKHGTIIGAAVMGALSALIVGPCVAAPLAGALIYIGQTGDAVLGGLALFAMGMGMGAPLLLIGISAGKLLPKAGPWMNATKAVFGVGLLAVAIWLMDRILPAAATMVLWALLLIIPAVYMSALDALPANASGWRKLWKGAGLFMLTYGILILVGVAAGGTNPLQPLQALNRLSTQPAHQNLAFQQIASVTDLEQRITTASSQNQFTMLDFYADWCISCVEMENFTFSDPSVQKALSNVALLQADVTKNSLEDKELLERFDLIGPPAILFFGSDRKERDAFRIIGYKSTDEFLRILKLVGI